MIKISASNISLREFDIKFIKLYGSCYATIMHVLLYFNLPLLMYLV